MVKTFSTGNHWDWFVYTLVCLAMACGSWAGAAGKPIAVVAGREKYDLPRLDKRVLAPSGFVWVDCGEFLDPREFERYSIVIWLSGCKREFCDEETSAMRAYLEGGGRMLHTGEGVYLKGLARNFKAHPWLGAGAWHYHRDNRPTFPCLMPGHPYLSGVDTTRSYAWQTAYFSLDITTNMTRNLVGQGQRSLFCATGVGKGELIWLWEGLFRARNWQEPEGDVAQDRIFLNIIAAARPLKAAELARRNSPELARDPATLICWRRDWQFAFQDDYVFLPPHAEPGETLEHLTFNSAMDELDTQFLLCQSLASQHVNASLAPLVRVDGNAVYSNSLTLHISERPPAVPSLINTNSVDFPARLGRFMLTPVTNGFAINDWRPRVLWIQFDTHGLGPGAYASELILRGARTERRLPLAARVYPVRMPRQRIADLRYWGAGFPTRQPFLRELRRQGCAQMTISYPPLDGIRVRATGQTLAESLRRNPGIFAADKYPALDFRSAYETNVHDALESGLSNIRFHDVRTAATIAGAATGEQLGSDVRAWSPAAQELYRAYFRELSGYLADKGFADFSAIWSDEPSWKYIQEGYIPRAQLITAGGMGAGTHWTAGGFMSPEQINAFAPYTTDWSMYTIMLPNFLRFLHGDNHYRYQALEPLSSAALEDLKRRVLDHLISLRPYIGKLPGRLYWHDWVLTDEGRIRARLVLPDAAAPALRAEASRLLAECRRLSGREPVLVPASRWRRRAGVVDIVVGTAADEPVSGLLAAGGWQVDADYPGADSYLIKRDRTGKLLLIAGADEAGALRGLRAFAVFLRGEGFWIE